MNEDEIIPNTNIKMWDIEEIGSPLNKSKQQLQEIVDENTYFKEIIGDHESNFNSLINRIERGTQKKVREKVMAHLESKGIVRTALKENETLEQYWWKSEERQL